jgi:lipoate-protein ligase A
MRRIRNLRLIVDDSPNSGAWNMAVDEALLQSAIDNDIATLRWYQWEEPTVSIGYFQPYQQLQAEEKLSKLAAVRRLTGGGAILHHHEITYSIAIPATLIDGPAQRLYDAIHEAIADELRSHGFPVDLRGTTTQLPEEPLLCFLRADSHDLTLRGRKIMGSAQRRRRGAILQHGSLILKSSEFASDIPGIADLCSKNTPTELVELLVERLSASIADSSTRGSLVSEERENVRRLILGSNAFLKHR